MKDTKTLKWSDGSSRSIQSDFEHQIVDCKERDENFTLKLVYSAADSNVSDIPESIRDYTSVESFPHADDMNQLVMTSSLFKTALRQISSKGSMSTDDELVNIAVVFLGVWRGIDTNKRISLADIVNRAGNINYFNLAIYPDKVMKDECKSILDEIGGFEYEICGRELIWTLRRMGGRSQWTEALENAIIGNKPTTALEIVALLN